MVGSLQIFERDRFQDVRRVGAGNNATVFSARDQTLERRVALKISVQDTLLDILGSEHLEALGIAEGLRQFIDEVGDAARQRYTLVREARLLARVQHPNVVAALDIGVLDGSETLVMPLLSGGQLDGKAYPGSWEQVVELALQIGEGLAAIHEAGLLHRDFKPNNVLFDRSGRPQIADLGLACSIDDADAMADWPGTTAYMAPETRARRHRDQRDDLYAYCTVVFQMLHGHMPFASELARAEGLVSRIERRDAMPAAIHEVLVRGLHPNPDARWPDMPTLLSELREAAAPAPRRWWPWLAAPAVAASLFGLLATTSKVVWADACDDVSDELAAVWDREIEIELRGALGSRAGSDALNSWTTRWVELRARECEASERAKLPPTPSPCAVELRERFATTVAVLRTPHLRAGLDYAAVISNLPAPERCLDAPADTHADDRSHADDRGLVELRERDRELGLLLADREWASEAARTRAAEYMAIARAKQARYDIARAMFWRSELHRLDGQLDEAERGLSEAYERSTAIGADLLGADVLLKLAAVAGERGETQTVDAYVHVALAVLERDAPDRAAEALQVHGLALLGGSDADRGRALELLAEAVAMRERQYTRYGGPRELIGEASEALACAQLANARFEEALASAQRSLEIHDEAFNLSTARAQALRRIVFVSQVELGRLDEADLTRQELLDPLFVAQNFPSFFDTWAWFAAIYEQAAEAGIARDANEEGRRIAEQIGADAPGTEIDRALGLTPRPSLRNQRFHPRCLPR
ncbi:Serine/threonine-protein kinase PrkC [Enhygromyxa salina]|uniref:Serine/threonine-protein kinase PrkC n=1 Tax=Enhygromyxa salina TaxID=215803 RepID=A0A2S9YEU3_9BACT|nr:serine/threonine-protein kinase [Enhygromyxa salina]PRQ03630.1 Serine/threonine-protein kinase PrkC [Enhygromyxa salina]